MALWLALALPALPLQLATRALDSHGMDDMAQPPIVITDGPAQRPRIAFANGPARTAGIGRGLKLAAAQALASHLIALPREPAHEHAALHELACWAYQFSGVVVPAGERDPHAVLLEIGGSLRLFGGRTLLLQRLRRELAGLGYRACAGIAPTRGAAYWIAVMRTNERAAQDALSADQLPVALDPLPLAVAGWDADVRATLGTLGLSTLGELRRLPRPALRKRFAAAIVDDLDRAYGRAPDPPSPFAPPERFDAGIELPADVVDSTQLMFPAQRLLCALEGFLRGRNAGATELAFSALHSPRRAQPVPPTPIVLSLAAPERDAQRLARLLGERLNRVQLPEPAIALRLAVTRLLPFAAHNASLLPPAPDEAGGLDWIKLAETLHARLGSERVFQLQPIDDHRPEHAQRPVPVGPAPIASRMTDAQIPALGPRPLLLLTAPQPLAVAADQVRPADRDGPLTLVTGPERIESGWWDLGSPAHGAPARAVHRDYFVARNVRGQVLWIFRELVAPRRWFLHGFFA